MADSPRPVRLLHLEDSLRDAQLIADKLAAAGLNCEITTVRDQPGFEAAVATRPFDLILCDYNLSGYDGYSAMQRARQLQPDAPVIFLSGSMGEEDAVQSLQQGATDYVLKHRLERLVPAVRRALGEARELRKRRQAEAELRERTASLIESQRIAHLGNWDWNILSNEIRWSDETYRIFGQVPQHFSTALHFDAFIEAVHPDDRQQVQEALAAALNQGMPFDIDHRVQRSLGGERVVHQRGRVFYDSSGRPVRMVGNVQDITERTSAADQIRQSEALLRLAGRIARLGGWTIDYPEQRLTWSDEVCAIHEVPTGNSPTLEQMLGYYLPEQRSRLAAALTTCAEAGTPFDIEAEIRSQGGRRLWVRIIGQAEHGPAGTVSRVHGAFQDISDRKRAEQAVRNSEIRLRAIVDASPVPEALNDAGQNITFLNPAFVQTFGYTLADIPTLADWWQRAYPDPQARLAALAAWNRALQAMHSDGTPFQPQETTVRCRNGEDRTVLVSAALLDPAFDDVQMIVLYDITERKRAEAQARDALEQLRRSELQYRLLFANNPHPMWVYDRQTLKVVAVNDAAIEHYGYREAEWLAMDTRDVVAAADLPEVDRILEARGELEVHTGIWRHRRRDGSVIDVEVTTDSIVFDGRTARLLLAHDVTERVSAERKLERSLIELRDRNTELHDFAFIASHDLQEPLRKVRAFADRLATRCARQLDAQGLDYLQRMTNAAARMQILIDDLLSYSRVLRQTRPFVRVDLDQVLRDVAGDLEERLRESGGQLQLVPLPTIWGDPVQLGQVFQNLVANALKYRAAERPPQVRVDVQPATLNEAAAWQIRICDNGIGFDNEFRERIFGPFQRLHGRAEYEGTGIGLAIVRRIVERHGGSVSASGTPNQGAVFTLLFPVDLPGHLLLQPGEAAPAADD